MAEQRGSNENTNGLLRQYLPRRFDFKTLTQDDLDAIALELDDRPRQMSAPVMGDEDTPP